MEWRSLGVVTPSENLWQAFSISTATNEIFRLTYAAPRAIEKLHSYGWLAWRAIGASLTLPPSLALRIFPDSRGRLIILPFPFQLEALGYNRRIFEIKRSSRDVVDWSVQLEELI